jgi:hypothetical protein
MVLLKTVLDGSAIKFKPVSGQGFENLNVQGSKKIRFENHVGTIFSCDNLENAGSFYRAVGEIVVGTTPRNENKTAIKTKSKDTLINILEFI